MEQEKRKVIVGEIEHWRRSKLLPEHYCDFLKNLYADANEATPSGKTSSSKASAWNHAHPKAWIYAFTIFTVIAILSLNFTAFPWPLQMGIALIVIGAAYTAGVLYRDSNTILSIASLGVGTLLLLLTGPLLLRLHGSDTPTNIGLYIAGSCMLWIVIGLLLKIRWFHFTGWLGLSLVYAWIVYQKADTWSWWLLHAVWIPIALFFGWMAWMLRRSSKGNSMVLLVVCIIQWFIPDALSLWLNGASGLTQGVLLSKIILAGLLLFSVRRRWVQSTQPSKITESA
jgi:hypothetical protein